MYCIKKKDGSYYGPTSLPSDLIGKSQSQLAALGWYPYKEEIPEFDPLIEMLVFEPRILDVDGYVVDPKSVALKPVELARATVCGLVKAAMYARLTQGIIYKFNNGADPYPLQIRPSMRDFLDDMNSLRQRGRANPHAGKIWQNNTGQGYIEFTLDDDGLDELVLFSGVWGHKISQIANAEDTAVKLMDSTQLAAYNANAIDWSITWDQADQNRGWTDDTMLQIPI